MPLEKTDATKTSKGFGNRDDVMDSLIATRNEDFEEETGVKLEEPTETDEEKAAREEKEEKEAADKADQDATKKDEDDKKAIEDEEKEKSALKPDEDDELELVVDGEKKPMKKADVIALAQKNLAADARLKEAEEKRREADDLLKKAQEEDKGLTEDEIAAEQAEVDKMIAEKRSAYLHAMNYGESEEQEAAMIEYEEAVKASSGKSQEKSIDTENLAATIKAELKEELTGDQIRDRFNLPESQGGFGDIMEDDDLKELCFAKIDRAIDGGADAMSWETYKTAAESVREKFITKALRQPDTTIQDKKNRKKAIDNLETVSDSTKTTVRKKSPLSSKADRSDTIAEMAKGRPGQQLY